MAVTIVEHINFDIVEFQSFEFQCPNDSVDERTDCSYERDVLLHDAVWVHFFCFVCFVDFVDRKVMSLNGTWFLGVQECVYKGTVDFDGR